MHRRLRVEGVRGAQAGHESPVLGDVVRGDADVLGGLREGLARRRVDDDRAVARGTRVAPGTAVGLDDELPHHEGSYRPDSDVRTRIRWQFSQRTTESGAAARTSFSSVMFSSSWQPSQRRW